MQSINQYIKKLSRFMRRLFKQLTDALHLLRGLITLGTKQKKQGNAETALFFVKNMNPRTRRSVVTKTVRSYILPKEKTISNYMLRGIKAWRR